MTKNPAAATDRPAITAPYLSLAEALPLLTACTDLSNLRKHSPMMNSVVLDVTSDGVATLSAFDFETGVAVTLPARDATAGCALIPFDVFTRLIAAAGKGETASVKRALTATVKVTEDGPELTVADFIVPIKHFEYVPILGDYPSLPKPGAPVVTVDRDDLAAELGRVVTSDDPKTPILGGVNLTVDEHGLTILSTDRFRLTRKRLGPIGSVARHWSGTVPVPALRKALAAMPPGPVTLAADGDATVTLTGGHITITARQLSGTYPSVWKIIPDGSTHLDHVTVPRAALVKAIAKAGALSTGPKETAPIRLLATPDGITVQPGVPGGAFGSFGQGPTIPATGGDFDGAILADPKRLYAAVSTFTGEQITLTQREPGKPVAVTDQPGEYADPSAYLHLVLPMRNPGTP